MKKLYLVKSTDNYYVYVTATPKEIQRYGRVDGNNIRLVRREEIACLSIMFLQFWVNCLMTQPKYIREYVEGYTRKVKAYPYDLAVAFDRYLNDSTSGTGIYYDSKEYLFDYLFTLTIPVRAA